jgi:hypothetical protein
MSGDRSARANPPGAEEHARDRGAEDLATPPAHGRGGRGAASILPHLNRQQQINDKPAPDAAADENLPQPGRAAPD